MHTLPSALLSVTSIVAFAADPVVSPNPFFQAWKTPCAVPPFGDIKPEHFLPAFKEGIAREKAEIQAIAESKAVPTFANTIEAMDRSGDFLDRVTSVFSCLRGAETNSALQAINREVSPMLAAHQDDISLNESLWKRVKTVWENRGQEKLDAVQVRLLEKTYKGFTRAGADLVPAKKEQMRAINSELSSLSVDFGDRLLKATKDFRLVITKADDLAGLSDSLKASAAQAAQQAGLDGKWLFTLDAPSIWPFLQHAENRDLRKQILTGYLNRGQTGETNTKAIAARTAALRTEKAQLLGYKTWADYILEENMAKNSARVNVLMDQLWKPALAKAKVERAGLQAMMDKDLRGEKLEAWDWRFYQEKVRKATYDLDEAALKPYFSLDKVRDGAFYTAGKLYGITFTERKDIPVYNPEVQVFEVKEKDGHHLGILYVDYHPRAGKRGGAWCGTLRDARVPEKLSALVTNTCNFTRPSGDVPALLTLDEVQTLFHEFGHALHALFYAGRYQNLKGTPRDFVELPSQIMEHWATEPDVLKVYARHYKTGDVIPTALVEKIQRSGTYGEGFGTTEYLAAALLDLDWHTLASTKAVDVDAFEKATAERLGLIPEIPFRYRTPYFNHIWAGGYSAGYYAYIWCAVLDSDAFQAFKEKGNLFDPATAKSFRANVLQQGNSLDPAEMFKTFRGRDPKVEPLLIKRGLN